MYQKVLSKNRTPYLIAENMKYGDSRGMALILMIVLADVSFKGLSSAANVFLPVSTFAIVLKAILVIRSILCTRHI